MKTGKKRYVKGLFWYKWGNASSDKNHFEIEVVIGKTWLLKALMWLFNIKDAK